MKMVGWNKGTVERAGAKEYGNSTNFAFSGRMALISRFSFPPVLY